MSNLINISSTIVTKQPLLSKSKYNSDRGVQEKWLAMLALTLGSLVVGMLPAIISQRNRRRFPLSTSLLLCFGAGVLLATSLVHILPEVRKQMNTNLTEISLCAGFFIIYFIDEFIHYFFGEAIQHTHNNQSAITISGRNNYGSVSETAPLITSEQLQYQQRNEQNHSQQQHHHNQVHVHDHVRSSSGCDVSNGSICRNHAEPCTESMIGTLGLFVALSLHSTIEGIVIGVQSTGSKVLFLLGAIACHKFVMGFCLGLELQSNPRTTLLSHLLGILVFAFGAVLGIGLGMLIVDVPSVWSTKTLPVIQALAGGTLFYVTVCELLPREKARWHQNSAYHIAGIAQFIAVVLGFTIMCIINFYLADNDS